MNREEQLKQAIEEVINIHVPTDVTEDALKYHDLIKRLKRFTGIVLSSPSILQHADPVVMKQAGWVREEEWISVEERLPEENKIVTVKYYKHKKGNWSGNTGIFITQAYYVERDHFNFDGNFLYRSKEWYDYTDRLIWDVNSQSKNKVISWTTITI